ncbi:WXG100 family type VII secretion target [Amycolatopsis sp. WQ 127309]|uniref:WXG100 family type VII secretion target n=1 Tax=Amycolatopsis sp. WQ 127309 TaxID=2932773 RepID=UPI001FF4B4CE|nr:hypothetical protein [Amycolatopsis sp. WQ 127309]UOZ06953.1 hypothetical protein MUY22_01260 [Amycolatopsis sp. WQ 127309]
MADEFRLDAPALRKTTTDLHDAVEKFTETFRRVQAGLAEHDGCWGSDEPGKAFAKNYVETAKDIQTGVQNVVNGVTSTGKSLDDASARFVGLDEESAKAMDKSMGDQLGH